MEHLEKMKGIWKELYPEQSFEILENFIKELDIAKDQINLAPHGDEWYKDAIVYSLYVDLFNHDFPGLVEKLDYLSQLGVNCLWLLPILDSPMRDAGFDISDYRKIRPELLGAPSRADHQQVFVRFLEAAHKRGIKVIFDIAINHTSEEHPWFRESRKSKNNPYRDYYIWSNDTEKFKEARIIFKGLCESNWEKDGEEYFFHRFFEFQPDLNFKNPVVLLEMSRNMIYWLSKGVDGFRADAIPYLWKEEGTACENLPKTHTVVKFFRTVLDYIRSNTLLLAEACQKPKKVVKYFGDGDECNAGYHFPLMPQMFKSLAMESGEPIKMTLSKEVTPEIPYDSQWFTFLRCHDELSLELVYVTEEERKYIHDNYCKKPEWNFRLGQGISARLSELMDRDPAKIGLIYSVMLTLPGTPVIYYGDEFGKQNDKEFYDKMIKVSGKDDTRFLVRGEIDWAEIESGLEDPESYISQVYSRISKQINSRKKLDNFGRGEIQFFDIYDHQNNKLNEILAYLRTGREADVLVLNNLSNIEQNIKLPLPLNEGIIIDLLGQEIPVKHPESILKMSPFSYFWILL